MSREEDAGATACLLPGGVDVGGQEAGEDGGEQVRLGLGDVLGPEVGDGGDAILDQSLRNIRRRHRREPEAGSHRIAGASTPPATGGYPCRFSSPKIEIVLAVALAISSRRRPIEAGVSGRILYIARRRRFALASPAGRRWWAGPYRRFSFSSPFFSFSFYISFFFSFSFSFCFLFFFTLFMI